MAATQALFICILVLILNAANSASSRSESRENLKKLSTGDIFSSFKNENLKILADVIASDEAFSPYKNIVADVIHLLERNQPEDGQQLHFNQSELDDVIQKIRMSGYLDDLRALSKRWQEKKPTSQTSVDPDVYYNMSGLVSSKGYPIEEYEVKTEDGYILGLFRIPHGRNHANATCCRQAVFLQHGLLAASTNWVENLANESLAFLLADAGFDVWMGNMRGNTYSRKHAWLDPNKPEFWQFNWDEMAKYDIPAMVNFALAKSGHSRLAYIGHSQGTLVAFTGFAINPELGQKISCMVALGPVYTVASIKLEIRDLVHAGLAWLLSAILSEAGADEFLPKNYWTNTLAARTICAWPGTEFLCVDTLLFFGGHSHNQLNRSRVQVYISNNPAGTSLMNMKHYIQMVATDKCLMYDYGAKGNLIKYNQTKPPEYHIEDLQIPVALFWGAEDDLADPEDVKELIPRIPHLIYSKEIENFEHLDFIWAQDAKDILYDDIIHIIQGKVPVH